MKLKDFREYLETDLLKDTGKSVSMWFARTMLLSLGWCHKRRAKGIYYDGHERPDVREARKVFLDKIQEFEKSMTKYSGTDCEIVTPPNLPAGQQELVLVVHDEATVYAYENESSGWVEEGKGFDLQKKEKGPTVNLSMFLAEDTGRLRFTDEQYAEFKRRHPESTLPQDSAVFMKSGAAHATAKTGKRILGIAHNGYWTNKHVLAQVKIAVQIFEYTHPDKKGVFIFDNSTGHNAFADDALIAHHLNYRPGGKQNHLRKTKWNDKVQHMDFVCGDRFAYDFTYDNDDETIQCKKGARVRRGSPMIGVQKGSKQVCLERKIKIRKANGKWIRHCCKCAKKTEQELFQDELLKAAGKMDQITDKIRHAGLDADGVPCCCVWALSQCEDFKQQQNSVQELIEKLGHHCLFLPKFHPELNFIERFWSRLKWWLRQHCEFSLKALWNSLEEACASIPLSLIRKYARTSWRYMSCYRMNWSPELSAFAAKSYHGHRGVPPSMDALINDLKIWKAKKVAEKGQLLLDRDRRMRREEREAGMPPDLMNVDPMKLTGLKIRRDFDGFGVCEGVIKSVDREVGTDRVIFRIEYLDGDVEDLYLSEMVESNCLRPDEVLLHVQ